MKILIILPNWIGDVVMSLPCVEKIREFFPTAKIYCLIRKDISQLIEENLKKLEIAKIEYGEKSLRSSIEIIKVLRKLNFSKAFVLPRSFRMFFISVFSNIKKIYGFGNDFLRKIFFKGVVKRDKHILTIHRTYYYLQVLKLIKDFNEFNPPQIYIPEKYKKWADDLLNYLKIKNKILIGINPGSTYGEAKCWKVEKFIYLIEKLKREIPCEILLFGGKDNVEKCEIIRKKTKKVYNFAGKLTLMETASLIEKLHLFITNDTGPMHIADALGKKIVAIFGPTDVNETYPFRKNGIILYKNLPCSPCKKRVCPYGHNRCMEEIEVSEVFNAVKKLIDTKIK